MRQLLILALLTGGVVDAQTLTLSASAPTPVSSLSASRVGIAGSTIYCYHVIAVYPIGRTAETVACVTNGADTLSVSNWNRVAWGASAGATGYYLIRNATPDTVGSCTSCLLVNNTLTTTVNDDGSISPSNYTAISPASPVSVTVSLNNQNFPAPEVMFPTYTLNVTCLQFPDATQLCSGSPSASGTVTHSTGPLTAGQLIIGNGLGDIKVGDLSGDVSTAGGTVTTLGTGVVGPSNLNPSLFSGTGTAFCTVTGTLGSTHVVRFDASGNCIQSSATIDNSGNYSSPGNVATGVGGTVAGASFFGVQASGPSLPAGTGYAGIGVGTGAIAASYGLLLPTTGPSVTSVLSCPPLSAGFSQCTFTTTTTPTVASYTVATLPANSAGTLAYVTDGANNSDCTVGSGTNKVLCIADGTNWQPLAYAGTPILPPPPSSSTIGDFWVVRTSPTVLTVGQNCTTAFPCRVAFGATTFEITAPATATISAGSDTAYVYISDAQVLSVGTAADTVVCSGCTSVGSISAFPPTSIPLWNWTASSGTWSLAGGTDQRTIVQKGADPLGTYLLTSADTQLKNAVLLNAQTGASFNAAMNVRGCVIDNDTQSATPLAAAQFSGGCPIATASHIIEIDTIGSTLVLNGTPASFTYTGAAQVAVGLSIPGSTSTTDVMSALLVQASGVACSLPVAGSATCPIMGITQAGSGQHITTTAIPKGNLLYMSAAVADTPTHVITTIWYTVD